MALNVGSTINLARNISTGNAPGQSQYQGVNGNAKVAGMKTVNGQNYYNLDFTQWGGGTGWALGSDVEGSLGGGNPSPQPGGVSAPSTVMNSPRVDYAQTLIDSFKADDSKRAETSAAARDKLIGYYSNLEDPTSRYTRLRDENGVSQQQGLVDALTKNVMTSQDTIDDLEGSVNNRTKDFFVGDDERTAILARERDPLEKNLVKLLRAKQYEEIGLQGKQQLVSELLNLSFKKDEMGARPLQLGVDYTEEDRRVAQQLFSDIMGKQLSAYSADETDRQQTARDQESRDFQLKMNDTKFNQDKELKQIDLQNDLAKLSNSKGTSNAKSQAQTLFNQYLGDSNHEGELWEKIKNNESSLRQQGVDVDEIWRLWSEVKAKVGTHGALRKTEEQKTKTYTINGKTYTVPA